MYMANQRLVNKAVNLAQRFQKLRLIKTSTKFDRLGSKTPRKKRRLTRKLINQQATYGWLLSLSIDENRMRNLARSLGMSPEAKRKDIYLKFKQTLIENFPEGRYPKITLGDIALEKYLNTHELMVDVTGDLYVRPRSTSEKNEHAWFRAENGEGFVMNAFDDALLNLPNTDFAKGAKDLGFMLTNRLRSAVGMAVKPPMKKVKGQ